MIKSKLKPFKEIWLPLPRMRMFEEIFEATDWAKNLIKEVDNKSETC